MDTTSSRKHTVLVSNDDGIQAPGLTALVAALAESPDIEVFVCAPSGERSAQSHAITLGRWVGQTPEEQAAASVSLQLVRKLPSLCL
jgi:5'-nucleotidase